MYLKREANGRTFVAETGANGLLSVACWGENYEHLDCTGELTFKELSEHAEYLLNYNPEQAYKEYLEQLKGN